MIHRLALLFGVTGAAGVVAVALALGGGATPSEARAQSDVTAIGGGVPITVVDKVYVLPASEKPDKPKDAPRHPRNHNDENASDEANDTEAGEDGDHQAGDAEHANEDGQGGGDHESESGDD